MEGEPARSALKTVYDETLLAFEEASDKAEDLASPEPSSQLREAIVWLENATTSLISWGIDIRADAGSLAATEGTPLETEVRCALCELQIHLDKVFDERSSRSVSNNPDSLGFPLSSDPKEGESAADEDPIAIMSGLIGVLQDFVRPIRMLHASITGEGPYRNLKRQIDSIYNQHIERRDRPGFPPLPNNSVTAHRHRGSYREPVVVADVLSDTNQPSVAVHLSNTESRPVQGASFEVSNTSSASLVTIDLPRRSVIHGEAVNTQWGVTKAGSPPKRLVIACTACQENKIECDPRAGKCEQCENFGRECRFTTASLQALFKNYPISGTIEGISEELKERDKATTRIAIDEESGNSGFQLGSNAGQVQVYAGGQSAEPNTKKPLGSLRRSRPVETLPPRPRPSSTVPFEPYRYYVDRDILDQIPPRPRPSSTVPFKPCRYYVDRDILDQIPPKCSEPASRAALVGQGGVGKSQLAIQYSYQVREQDPSTWVFWVYAGSATRLEEGCRTIAEQVKLPHRDEPGADVVRLVSDWLCDEANERWILILDNVDDPAIFTRPHEGRLRTDAGNSTLEAMSLSFLLPKSQNGSILATSRNRDVAFWLTGSDQNIITVEPMDEKDALRLLRKTIDGEIDEGDAVRLVQALDCMPLAITQAAAYIKHRAPRITVSGYLDAFRKSDHDQASLLNRDAGDLRIDQSAKSSIVTSWQISFEHIRRQRLSAARLLSLMSLFDRQTIPEWLLHRGHNDNRTKVSSSLGVKTNPAKDVDIDFQEDIYTLADYSLIRKTTLEDGFFNMHQLVQLSTRKWLELSGELEMWTTRYLRMILQVFPHGEYETWTQCRALFPHAEVVLRYQPAGKQDLLCWAAVLNRAGWYAGATANYSVAEAMHRRALEGSEKALGEEHPKLLSTVGKLALALQYQGKYNEAEELDRRALENSEKALGKKHPDTLTSISNLASVLLSQGKYEEAEKLNWRALEGREKALGEEHPDTLTSMGNLAELLSDQGKWKQAEELKRQALRVKEKTLGKEHPDTLQSVHNLAYLHTSIGDMRMQKHSTREHAPDFRLHLERIIQGLQSA